MKMNIFLEKELEGKEGCVGLEELSYDNTPIDFNSFEQEQKLLNSEMVKYAMVFDGVNGKFVGSIQPNMKEDSLFLISVEELKINPNLHRPITLRFTPFTWNLTGEEDE